MLADTGKQRTFRVKTLVILVFLVQSLCMPVDYTVYQIFTYVKYLPKKSSDYFSVFLCLSLCLCLLATCDVRGGTTDPAHMF